MNKKDARKLARKTLQIRETRFAPEQALSYNDAMARVRSLRKAGHYATAKSCLEQVCEQVSLVPEPHLYLLNICIDGLWMDQAEQLVDFLMQTFPKDNQVLTNCVRFYRAAGDVDRALALLDRAVALHPRNDENHAMRGLVYKSSGDSAAALHAFGKALARNPNNIAALEGKVGIQGKDADGKLLEAIDGLLKSGKYGAFDQAALHFALAEASSRSDSEMQFSHLHAANRLVADWRPYEVKRDAAKVREMISIFDEDAVAGAADLSAEEMAPIFIIAMPRSGTTLLERMLGGHSRLHNIGESGAFQLALEDRGQDSALGSVLRMPPLGEGGTREQLLEYSREVSERFRGNYFVRPHLQGRVVDKSIENFYLVGCILLVYPHARIIDLQRHPLDVIYSCYRQNFAAGVNFAFNLEWMADKYLLYAQMMQHWRALFGDRLLGVNYETLVSEPEPVLRGILDYCDLAWEPACLEFNKNKALVTTASDLQVRKPLYQGSIYSWKRVEEHLRPAIERLGPLADYTPNGLPS